MTDDERLNWTSRIFLAWDMWWVRYYDFQIEKCQSVLERTTMRRRSFNRKKQLLLEYWGGED